MTELARTMAAAQALGLDRFNLMAPRFHNLLRSVAIRGAWLAEPLAA
jgi:hypothetical protein